ncbi:HET-domain-containing protein [Biscogniauxia marginata]|nr:HET-domain-containing protein [Biscogniauxia marginata]
MPATFAEELIALYPEAKVILTIREDEEAVTPLAVTLLGVSTKHRDQKKILDLFWRFLFFDDLPQHDAGVYREHIDMVKKLMEPKRLLSFDAKQGSGPFFMLCNVCREGLQGIWDPEKTKRVGQLRDFLEILEFQQLDGISLLEVENYVFGHHTSYDSLLRSKQQGCVACATFGEANDADDVNATFAELGYYSVFCISLERRDMYTLPLMLVYSGETLEEFPIEFVAHDKNDAINSALATSTASSETWALVQNWLDQCLSNHEACHSRASPLSPGDCSSPSSSSFTPTRLLELQTSPPLPIPAHLRSHKRSKNAPSSFRLVDRTQYPTNLKYITLSHCWGPGPAHTKLRLTMDTESKLRRGLPVSVLPRTFRDAFEIVSRFRVRYLWIDRLCIVQDSAADWAAEAGTMQGVYRGGFLNIAALGAADDEAGCFAERDPALAGPGVVNLSPKGKPPSYYRHPDEASTGWKTSFASGPLIGRAWVLQERLLAVRNLYFGRNQVFWECCTNTCCETMPAGPLVEARAGALDNQARADSSKATKGDLFAWKALIDVMNSGGKPSSGTLDNLLGEWSGIVNIYSTCGLTFTSDKLVAVSGLADDMRAKLKALGPGCSDYIAGIWRVSLPHCLMWTVKGPSERPAPYRAPSWSWASVKGVITLPAASSQDCLVNVVSVDILNKGDGVTGQVIGGSITMKGPLCVARGVRPSKTKSSLYNCHVACYLHHPDTFEPYDLPFDSVDIRFDDSNDQYDELTILPFWCRRTPSPPMESVHGLALVQVGGSRSSYRRVGLVSIIVYHDPEAEKDESCTRFLKECPMKTVEVI